MSRYSEILRSLEEAGLYNSVSSKASPWLDRRISEELKASVIDATKFLEYDANLADRVSIMRLGITEQPKCECGKLIKYDRTKKNFLSFCSLICARNSIALREKVAATCLEKFGATSNLSLLTTEQRKKAAKKAVETRKQNGIPNPMHRPEVLEKHKQSITKPGVQEKRKNTIIENFGSWESFQEYRREKMQVGEFSTYDKEKYSEYRKQVWFYTNQQDLTKLENIDKRGRLDLNENAYHLDHSFSCLEGFKNNIPPSIVGHLSNLRMIPGAENIVKSDACHGSIGLTMAIIELQQG